MNKENNNINYLSRRQSYKRGIQCYKRFSLNILIKWKTLGKADQLKERRNTVCVHPMVDGQKDVCMRVQRRACLWIRFSF